MEHWRPTSRPGLEPRPLPPESPEDRLRCAFDLHVTAVTLLRQSLQRRHPEYTDQQVQEAVLQWLHTRPGAQWGDGVGTPRSL